MKYRTFRVRTFLIAVVAVALLIELVGLGRRSRHYAAQAQTAASAETINLRVVANSRIAASQCVAEADQVATTDPTRAAALRARASFLGRHVPFFEAQAKEAAGHRATFERAMTHPWKGDPPDATRLLVTPPPGP